MANYPTASQRPPIHEALLGRQQKGATVRQRYLNSRLQAMRKCRVVLEGQDTTAACDKRVKSYGQPEGREGFCWC